MTKSSRHGVKAVIVATMVVLTLSASFTTTTLAATDPVANVLKLFGIGYVVTKFGPQINEAVNTLTLNKKCQSKETTKVVPILSLGTGAHVGAAQVSGSAAQVSKVVAVAQLEAEFSNRAFRTKALVPINTMNPSQNMQRVTGVGISAIVDLKI